MSPDSIGGELEAKDHPGRDGETGPVPDANKAGSGSGPVQDKPDLDAFAAKFGMGDGAEDDAADRADGAAALLDEAAETVGDAAETVGDAVERVGEAVEDVVDEVVDAVDRGDADSSDDEDVSWSDRTLPAPAAVVVGAFGLAAGAVAIVWRRRNQPVDAVEHVVLTATRPLRRLVGKG